jgi:ribosomal-protein-alanine N-acetyltransferase
MKAIIRRMTLDDLDEILKIEGEVFPDCWSRRSFEFEVLHNKYSLPLVMTVQNKIVGYSVVWKLFEEFHIANIAIHPQKQNRGLGSYFLQEILNLSAEQDYAILEVRESNQTAIHLYQKFGFFKLGIRTRYYANGENALIMKKQLIKTVNDSSIHINLNRNTV